MERNLALELVRVTEAAALAAARWMGMGDGEAAERAAQDAVAKVMTSVRMDGRVVIGDLDGAVIVSPPAGDVPVVDIALDALQSTVSVAFGRPNAISVIAVSNRDAFFDSPLPYMSKIAVGPDAAGCIDITVGPMENLVNIADAKRCYVEDITVCILERDRHTHLVEEVRTAGARIKLIPDGDMAAAIATAIPDSGIHVLMGVGGSIEGVLAAAALKCVGGDMQARVHVRDENDKRLLQDATYGAAERVLKIDDLVGGANTMVAVTGITDSDFVPGVQFVPGGAITHSIVMRNKSGTVRSVRATHRFDRKPAY